MVTFLRLESACCGVQRKGWEVSGFPPLSEAASEQSFKQRTDEVWAQIWGRRLEAPTAHPALAPFPWLGPTCHLTLLLGFNFKPSVSVSAGSVCFLSQQLLWV